jgi:hypothetical protein
VGDGRRDQRFEVSAELRRLYGIAEDEPLERSTPTSSTSTRRIAASSERDRPGGHVRGPFTVEFRVQRVDGRDAPDARRGPDVRDQAVARPHGSWRSTAT